MRWPCPGTPGSPIRDGRPRGGNLDELRARYGPRLGDRQREAVASIRDAIEATRAATKGARHPTYMRSAATIVGLCRYWCIGLDEPRELLEEAYLSTLDPDEARKREVGSVYGVWNWLESGEARQQPKELHPAVLASIAAGWSGDRQ